MDKMAKTGLVKRINKSIAAGKMSFSKLSAESDKPNKGLTVSTARVKPGQKVTSLTLTSIGLWYLLSSNTTARVGLEMDDKSYRVRHYERNGQSGRADSSSSHSSSEMEHNTASTCANHFYVTGPQVMKMVTPGHSKSRGPNNPLQLIHRGRFPACHFCCQ